MTPIEALTRFAAARVARLATSGDNGTLHLVPITFAARGDIVVSAVDAKPKTTRRLRRLRNIERNPAVCLLADHYEEDWTRLWWVRADGVASVLADDDEAIGWLREKYPQYRDAPPYGPVIRVTVDRWTGWSP